LDGWVDAEHLLLFLFAFVTRKGLELLLGVVLSLASRHGDIIRSMEESASKLGPSGRYIVLGEGGRKREVGGGSFSLATGGSYKSMGREWQLPSLGRGEEGTKGEGVHKLR
jgi:hypothetical protein